MTERQVSRLGVISKLRSLQSMTIYQHKKGWVPKRLRSNQESIKRCRDWKQVQTIASNLLLQAEKIAQGIEPNLSNEPPNSAQLKMISAFLFGYPEKSWSNTDIKSLFKTSQTFKRAEEQQDIARLYDAIILVLTKRDPTAKTEGDETQPGGWQHLQAVAAAMLQAADMRTMDANGKPLLPSPRAGSSSMAASRPLQMQQAAPQASNA